MPHDSPQVELNVLSPASCDDCGLCCEGIGSPVLWYSTSHETATGHPFRPDGLPQRLIAEIDAAFAGLWRGQEPEERCLWYDVAAKRCRHYEWRPQVCRDYELGGAACLAVRQQAATKCAMERTTKRPGHGESEETTQTRTDRVG